MRGRWPPGRYLKRPGALFFDGFRAARLRAAAPRFVLAVALGTVGGAVFFALALPLPWMLGAMTAATAAALAGAPIAVPGGVRNAMIAILGVLLGSQFTADVFASIAEWYVGLSGVVLTTAATVAVAYITFRKLGGYDRATAYFASMPGGLSEMMVMGDAMGGNGRTISLSHGTRILVAVFLIAFYFRLVEGVAPVGLPVPAGPEAAAWSDIAALIACALVGYPAAWALRVPAAQLVGPMVLSAALHLSGLVAAHPPGEVIAAAQVVLGAAIGARFVGMALRELRRVVLLAVLVTVLMVLVAAGAAYGLAAATDFSGTVLFLALAPGGLAEMSLIALSMGSAAAFVSTLHIARIMLIVVAGPLVFRLAQARRRSLS